MRATQKAWAARINATLQRLKGRGSRNEAVRALMEDHALSRRQAYRYVQAAKAIRHPVVGPEEKVVFTVKLPRGLVTQIRRLAQRSHETISGMVTQALERFLGRRRPHG